MKRRNLIFVMLLVFSGLFITQSCKKESPVAFTEKNAFTIPTLVAPGQGFIDVPGTTVTLQWASTNAGGDPENWLVYFGTGDDPALIETGYTSESITVNVAPGMKYNWKVVGTDKQGMTTRSPVWSFEVVDPNSPIDLKMTWTTDVKTIVGLDLAPEDAANLRLMILKDDTITLATPIINTTGFEEFPDFSTLADGVYFVAADLTSSINAGDFTKVFDISINLSFTQRGILSDQIPYPNVMTTANPCSLYSTVLAKVTKTGNTITVDQALRNIVPPTFTWGGTDATYAEKGTYTLNCNGGILTGLLAGTTGQNGWMFDWWGEVIVDGGSCSYTLSGNNITIPLQYFCTTTYLGAQQTPYYILGTGTIDNSGPAPKWTLHYDIKQGSTLIGNYSFINLGWVTDGFDAVLDGATAKSLNLVALPRPPKPVR